MKGLGARPPLTNRSRNITANQLSWTTKVPSTSGISTSCLFRCFRASQGFSFHCNINWFCTVRFTCQRVRVPLIDYCPLYLDWISVHSIDTWNIGPLIPKRWAVQIFKKSFSTEASLKRRTLVLQDTSHVPLV